MAHSDFIKFKLFPQIAFGNLLMMLHKPIAEFTYFFIQLYAHFLTLN